MTDLFPRRTAAVWAGAAALAVLSPLAAHAQLRVATWNISNYTATSTDRSAALKSAVYDTYQGRSMSPDVFMTQEFTSATSVSNFLSVLNTAPNSPGDWAAAPFLDGPDTDSAFFYRTSKVTYGGTTTVSSGGNAPLPPRDTRRYDVTLKGYSASATNAPKLALYSVHLKAGSTTGGSDEARREAEANAIRANAQTLPAGTQFLVGGDFNVASSNDRGFASFVESRTNNAGRFVDPINTPGTWENKPAMSFVHTQDPTSAGMDDRYDFVLLGTQLTDGKGFDYIGDVTKAYSTSTWDDPNHSYRAWGNDGTSYGQQLKTTGNTMVGPTIAAALKTAATTSGGHLPIFLDLRTPGELAASVATINFGTVQKGSSQTRSFDIFNDVDTSIWTDNGIAEMLYSMQASSGFTVPGGTFSDLAGGGVNSHLVTLDTSTLGTKTGTLSLFSDGVLTRTISLSATVVPEPGMLAMIGLICAAAGSRRQRAATNARNFA